MLFDEKLLWLVGRLGSPTSVRSRCAIEFLVAFLCCRFAFFLIFSCCKVFFFDKGLSQVSSFF